MPSPAGYPAAASASMPAIARPNRQTARTSARDFRDGQGDAERRISAAGATRAKIPIPGGRRRLRERSRGSWRLPLPRLIRYPDSHGAQRRPALLQRFHHPFDTRARTDLLQAFQQPWASAVDSQPWMLARNADWTRESSAPWTPC